MFSFKIVALFLALLQLVSAAPIAKRGFSGDGTFYSVGLGSCGETSKDSQLVAALNASQMSNGGNPNLNPNCNKKANVKGPKGSVTVTIVDTCPTCNSGDLDLSIAAFMKIADPAQGRVHITWSWA